MLTTSGTHPWLFVTQIFHKSQLSHGGDRKMSELMTSISPKGTISSVASDVCFVDRCLSFCTFSLGHCVLRYTDSD
jgi:hypothetical protein